MSKMSVKSSTNKNNNTQESNIKCIKTISNMNSGRKIKAIRGTILGTHMRQN